ncbi:ATP synthase subunit I [Paenalcaligenes sp. Me131]|uniref:ATP synthase subunit I n=1 Tax=Paenalcaligenes sp. Me131 TaxID=3392636 RepID=UPI003D2AE11A
MQRANNTDSSQLQAVGPETNEVQDHNKLVLTPEQRSRLAKRSGAGIVRVLMAQAVMAIVVILISWMVAGGNAALSALLGAAAYLIPNALFAMRLLLNLFSGKAATVQAFFVGELFKLGSALGILALVVWSDTGWLVWPALLFGLLGVLKGYVLLLVAGKLP